MKYLLLFFTLTYGAFGQPDPGCLATQGWPSQHNDTSDPTGLANVYYPEIKDTFWTTLLSAPTTVTIQGTFPAGRAMSLSIYNSAGGVVSYLPDSSIDPDAGQNNPFRTGTALGTYTIRAIWQVKPFRNAQPNTLYLGTGSNSMNLIYRVHYPTDPNDLAASVALPKLTIGSTIMQNCPVRPIIVSEDATVWGRLNNYDFSGTVPTSNQHATNPPTWSLKASAATENGYMLAVISRQFLDGNTVVVVQLNRPISPNNRAGQPPYSPNQVRFWTMAEKEPISTASVRSIADADSASLGNSSTYVISDPSLKPDDATLATWGATWIPWGALAPGDFVYDPFGRKLTNSDGVFYYGTAYYAQTFADPGFSQSMVNVSRLPASQQQAAMGSYWPKIGYCTLSQFAAVGAGCIN